MLKGLIIGASLSFIAISEISAGLSPVRAQLGTSQSSNYYGVEVTSNLSRDSDLATRIRNVANRQAYQQSESLVTWSSQGWIPYPNRQATYVSYERVIYAPTAVTQGSDRRIIMLLAGTLGNRPEQSIYYVDCVSGTYSLHAKYVFLASGQEIEASRNLAGSPQNPVNAFERDIVDRVCAF
jgi:hypothetical protein